MTSFPAIARFLVWDTLCFGCKKKMPDKCLVFGCNNRPNKEKGTFNFVLWDWWHGEAQKKKEVDQLRKIKVYSLETHKILGGVFKTCPRLLCYVFWFDYVRFWRKVLEGWYWDFDPRNLYFYRKQTSQKQASWVEWFFQQNTTCWKRPNLQGQ